MAPPVTLDALITPVSQPDYYNQIIAGHESNGVPWRSWLSPKNVGLSLSQISARLFATLSNILVQVARGMFLDYSMGVPLTLFAKSQFQLSRIPAQFVVGRFLLSGVPAGRPTTFSPGQITAGLPGAQSANSRLYTNQDSGALQPGTLNTGGANGLSIVQKVPGVSISFVVAGSSTPLSVAAATSGMGGSITVFSATDPNGNPVSSAADIATKIMANGTAAGLVSATPQGSGAAIIGALPSIALDGGALTLI